MAVFANGDVLVEYDVSIEDPLDEEVRITLFGTHVSDLIVVDNDDELVEYQVGSSQNEIVLNTPGVSSVRISYTTDLVDKVQGVWTFSLNSSIGFTVRLPPDTVLINTEPIPAIRPVGNPPQPLLTFSKPGSVVVNYAIGVLGTKDQANIAIQNADATIKETQRTHLNINLTKAESLLDRAIAARDADKFAEAEQLAGDANDAALEAGQNFGPAQTEIADAETQINQAGSQGRDVVDARQLIDQANSEFASGDYSAARGTAKQAIGAIGNAPVQPQVPIVGIVAAVAAAVGGVGALIFLKMRKPVSQVQQKIDPPKAPNNSRTNAAIKPPEIRQELSEPIAEEAEEASASSEPGTIPESQIDKSVLGRIVNRVLEERPHLRPEDQDVLKFLAEKEGAAFESEIRTKFQLPKTTIWRLVKRLEREELVEIRKAGGQNLIKLRFEDKMP